MFFQRRTTAWSPTWAVLLEKDMNVTHHSSLIDAALEISRKRSETLQKLKGALESGQTEEALRIAKLLCGINNEEKRDRVDTSIN